MQGRRCLLAVCSFSLALASAIRGRLTTCGPCIHRRRSLFKEGGQIIWVAPSGGRDRKDDNGEYQVAPFDPKSVEMFRLMADKAGRTTHFYPLSMLTYPICPPPEQVRPACALRPVRLCARL